MDAVTLGTPHDGAEVAVFRLRGQCASLEPGAADIRWVDGEGDPQGSAGTGWTVFGADADADADAVSLTASALHRDVPSERKVLHADVPHTGSDHPLHRDEVVIRAGEVLHEVGR